jgi:hypothetical protein
MSPWSSLALPVLLATSSPDDVATSTTMAAPATTAPPTTAAPTTTARLALTVAPALTTLRAPLVRALVDAGVTVAGPADPAASHRVRVEAADGGVVVVVTGTDTKLGVVPPGPPALVELEVAQRVAALVLATTPAPVATDVGVTVALQFDTTDSDDDTIGDVVLQTLLDGGVALAPVGVAPALCVVVDDDVVEVAVAPAIGAPCADGQPTARTDFRPAQLIERVRPTTPTPTPTVTPTPAPTPTPTVTTTTTTTTTPSSPWRFGVGGGVQLREGGADPLVWSSVAHRLARVRPGGIDVDVDVVGTVAGSGSIDDLVVVEPLVAVGVAGSTELAGVRLGAGLLGGAQAHGYGFEADVGVAGDGVLLVPVTVTLPLSDSVGLQLGGSGGASTRARSHTIDGAEAWRRGNIFLSLFGGLSFSLPGPARSAAPAENGDGLARGGG